MGMDESIVQRAVESRDPVLAEKAFREYDIAIEQSSDDDEKAGLLLKKAVLHGVFLQFTEARRTLEQARKHAASNSDIQLEADFIGASLYDQEAKYEMAFEQLTIVLRRHYRRLKSEPSLRFAYEDIQVRRALDAVHIGKFNEAILLLKESLSFTLKSDDRSNVLSSLGRCYSELEEYDIAREYFTKAMKVGLTKAWEGEVHMRLGVACANLGLLTEAKNEFLLCEERAIELGLEANKIHEWLSWVCKGLGEKSKSSEYERLSRPD
jgi:tetratricopeptide (TPR) repeat protein